jgi:hypothetical protein
LRWFAFWGSGGAGNEVPHAFLRARIVEGIVQVLWSASGGVMEKHILSAGGPFENRPKAVHTLTAALKEGQTGLRILSAFHTAAKSVGAS